MSIELASAKIVAILETKEALERKGSCLNFFSNLAETMILSAILSVSDGRRPDMETIFKLQHYILLRTKDKKTHELFEKAVSHLIDKPLLNVYQLDHPMLSTAEMLLNCEVALKEKHLESAIVVLFYKQVHAISVQLTHDDTISYFLESERASFIK